MSSSFKKRLIEIAIKLAPDAKTNQPTSFAESGTDTVTLSGFRTSVRIQNSGAPGGNTASVQVFGMSPSLMDQLSTLGIVFNIVPKNTVTISAGDEEVGLSPVFSGTIFASYGEYNAAPNVPFLLECLSGLADATAPAAASSFTGSTNVADIMAGFARQMNAGFENNGVSVQLSCPYFDGNLWTQMRTCAEHAGINAEIIEGKLSIWPKGGNRNTQTIPIVSKETGMIGYPAYTQQGILVRSLFNPQIAFGGLIKVESAVKLTTQTWAVNKLDLTLDSMVPKGHWRSTIFGYNPGYPRPIPEQAGASV